jgi:hypothetical protein
MTEFNQAHAVPIPTKKDDEFIQLQKSSYATLGGVNRSSFSSSHAEKRANHNAIERARRETLNLRFLELASSIPSLAHVRKPSKSVIVTRSIEYIQETKQRLEVKSRSLSLIRQQNEELKEEINRLRAEMGKGPVMFPDNIDLDLVYEAKLEHQKEIDMNFSQENRLAQQFSGSFQAGSPFDMNYALDDDEDEDRKSSFGSLMSPAMMDDRSFSNNMFIGHQNNQMTKPVMMNHQSILGHALQGVKGNNGGNFRNKSSANQFMHASSMPNGSPLAGQPIQGFMDLSQQSIHNQAHSLNSSHIQGLSMHASMMNGQHLHHPMHQQNSLNEQNMMNFLQ